MNRHELIIKISKNKKQDIVKKSANYINHKKLKPQHTKADLNRSFFNSLIKVIDHIKIFNRIDIIPEKKRHIEIIENEIKKCLDIRPGNHLLRQEYKFIKETMFIIEETQDRYIKIPELINEEYYQHIKKKI